MIRVLEEFPYGDQPEGLALGKESRSDAEPACCHEPGLASTLVMKAAIKVSYRLRGDLRPVGLTLDDDFLPSSGQDKVHSLVSRPPGPQYLVACTLEQNRKFLLETRAIELLPPAFS